jgi:hypothetical protein
MPTFDFTAPDGKSYSVDGPEGATQEQAFSILQQQIGTPAPSADKSSSVSGVAKSLGTGAAEGVIGLAGLPGDLYRMGTRALGDNLSPESRFGSDAIKKGVEGYTGEFYKPQGTAEEVAAKIGQFAPAVIGGPETIAAKLATRVAAPAVASEIGGKVAGPYGEIAGALIGAGGASAAANKFKEMAAARQVSSVIPTGQDLLKKGGSQFNEARDMNVIVKPDFATNAASDMRQAIRGFDPEAHKPVFAAADRLENLAQSGKGFPSVAVPMNEVENIRKQLVSLKTSPDASVREASRQAIKSLQQSQIALTSADTLAGDAGAFTKLSKEAIDNWAAGKRSNTVMGKAALGELNAATAGSGANEDNALRQSLKQLARPINNDITPKWQRLGFNQAEGAAIENVARGTPLGNTARFIGKGAPTGIVSAAGGLGIGSMAGGPVGAVALPAVGYIAKKIGDLSTKKAITALDSLVRSRSPLAAQVAALHPQIVQQLPSKTQRLLQAAILIDPVLSKASQPVDASRQ